MVALGLRLGLLTALFLAAAGQLRPIVQQVSDVTMKACPTLACASVNVVIIVGHQDPNFDISKLQVTSLCARTQSTHAHGAILWSIASGCPCFL